MIRITDIKLEIEAEEEILLQKIAKKLRISVNEILEWKIFRKSLDARKRTTVQFVYTVDIAVKNEKRVLNAKIKNVSKTPDTTYQYPTKQANFCLPPVIIGFGPAGMFSALILAQLGYRPIVLERGEDVDNRTKTVNKFWKEGILNEESNVQFGEGGAGTFSDGKLTTRIKDNRAHKVLEEFVKAGAPKEIVYESKPHIGTDKLKTVVKNMRETIISLGGKVLFNSKVTDIEFTEKNEVSAVIINKTKRIETKNIILSVGHSARDIFELLYHKKIRLTQKPFAMGVRIEHKQKLINEVQYSGLEKKKLGAADYRLTYTTKGGRAVFTFCMCPGGYVVAASSELGMVAVNGMSEYARDGENANSAILVQIFPEDLKTTHPLEGMYFQRELERRAFTAGGSNYGAPVQLVGDFLFNVQNETLGDVKPTYKPKVNYVQLNQILPPFMVEALKEAIPEMGKKLKGFDDKDALLTAVESRSSSPIRIERDETGQAMGFKGIYPAGEGAGYAGGIVSAAVDGILAVENMINNTI